MSKDKLITTVILMNQIREHTMLFDYHIVLASSGQATKKKLFHGTNGPEFTDDEKIKDALDIAMRHIEVVRECSEKLVELLNDVDKTSELETIVGQLTNLSSVVKH